MTHQRQIAQDAHDLGKLRILSKRWEVIESKARNKRRDVNIKIDEILEKILQRELSDIKRKDD